jgi:hypothetical protein
MSLSTDRRRSLNLVAAAIVVGAILVSAAIVLPQATRSTLTINRTITSTTTTTPIETTTVTEGSAEAMGVSGLDLLVTDNASTLQVGQRLNVQVSLFNGLPSTLSIPTSTDWQFKGIGFTLWAPCYYQVPAEAVVLLGNYSLANLPRANNVSFVYGCMEYVDAQQATFQPMSSNATLSGTYYGGGTAGITLGPFDLSGNFTTTGYWNMTENAEQVNAPTLGVWTNPGQSPVATPFAPGVYTIAVCDQWGDVAILHVTVEGN